MSAKRSEGTQRTDCEECHADEELCDRGWQAVRIMASLLAVWAAG